MGKISKGNNSVKNISGVTVLVPAYHLMVIYICTKFHENILDGIEVIERTIFMGKFSKGHNSVKNEGEVTVLVL